jgi:hypothetical protein
MPLIGHTVALPLNCHPAFPYTCSLCIVLHFHDTIAAVCKPLFAALFAALFAKPLLTISTFITLLSIAHLHVAVLIHLAQPGAG